MRVSACVAVFMAALVVAARGQEVTDFGAELGACQTQLAAQSSAQTSAQTALAAKLAACASKSESLTAHNAELIETARTTSETVKAKALASSETYAAEKKKYAEEVASFAVEKKTYADEVGSLKLEIASLEEQLFEFTHRKTPTPGDHLAGFFKSTAQLVTDVLPGVVEEGVFFFKRVVQQVTEVLAPAIPTIQKAAEYTTTFAKDLSAKTVPTAQAAVDAALPVIRSSVTKVTELRDFVQAAVYTQVLKHDSLAPKVTQAHTIWFANALVAVPVVLLFWRLFHFLFSGLFRVLFGKKRKVPKSAANHSVTLRTPTPDKKTAPFGASPARTRGRTIRSPQGEVLRFA